VICQHRHLPIVATEAAVAAQTTVPVVLSQRKISGSAWALLRAIRPAAEARLAPLFTKAVMEPKFQHQRPRPGTDPTVAAAASLPRPPLVLRRHNCVQALHQLSSNLGGRVYGSREGSARGVRGARAHLRRGTVRRLEGRDGFTRSAARGKGMLEITEGPARGAGDSCAAGLCARLLCCGTVRRRTFVPHCFPGQRDSALTVSCHQRLLSPALALKTHSSIALRCLLFSNEQPGGFPFA